MLPLVVESCTAFGVCVAYPPLIHGRSYGHAGDDPFRAEWKRFWVAGTGSADMDHEQFIPGANVRLRKGHSLEHTGGYPQETLKN